MDLGAYTQIDYLDALVKANGIDIPRLRGHRLMSEEEPVSQEEIKALFKYCAIQAVKDLCESDPFWDAKSFISDYDSRTKRLCKYYLVKDKDGRYVDIRWDRIHGWKRKILKFEIKKDKRSIQKQYDMWNKYAGQEGVLYIHSRMGGNNWKYWDTEKKRKLMSQPWFLDRVDDHWDSTYCDFYARVDTNLLEVINERKN